jgi:hypothetical protein
MLETIRNGIKRVVTFLKGESDPIVVQDELESLVSEIPLGPLSAPAIGSGETETVDLSRWIVTEHVESPFEKVGRLYLIGLDMVIRSDLDSRGFRVPLVDVNAVINGEVKDVRLLKTGKKVGTAQISTSGRAMNFSIDPFFYTTPLYSLTRMLAGEQRKAPLFVGREQVEG